MSKRFIDLSRRKIFYFLIGASGFSLDAATINHICQMSIGRARLCASANITGASWVATASALTEPKRFCNTNGLRFKKYYQSCYFPNARSTGLIERIWSEHHVLDQELDGSIFVSVDTSECDHVLSKIHEKDPIFLPKAYAALNYLTGSCDGDFDQRQSSFNFKFFINIENNLTASRYLLFISNQSFIRTNLYHIMYSNDPQIMSMRQGRNHCEFEDPLLKKDDLKILTKNFFKTLLSNFKKTNHTPSPFFKTSRINDMFFGYVDGKYFIKKAHQFDKIEDYNNERKLLEEKVKLELLEEAIELELKKGIDTHDK